MGAREARLAWGVFFFVFVFFSYKIKIKNQAKSSKSKAKAKTSQGNTKKTVGTRERAEDLFRVHEEAELADDERPAHVKEGAVAAEKTLQVDNESAEEGFSFAVCTTLCSRSIARRRKLGQHLECQHDNLQK